MYIASLTGVKQSEQIMEMVYDYEDETLLLDALPDDPEMIRILSVTGEALSVPPEGSILLEEGFARRHDLSTGDQMILDDVTLTVSGITREYYNSIQYISFDTAASFTDTESNSVLITLEEDQSVNDFISAAADTDGYLYYYSKESREVYVRSVLAALDLPCYVFALFSIIIGAVIISTMNLAAIAERRRKYAVMYVLGTSLSEFLSIELPEVILQFAATVLFGCAPAILCAGAMLRQMSIPSQEFVVIDPVRILLLSSAVVAGYLFIGVLVTIGAIRKMNYLEILSEK